LKNLEKSDSFHNKATFTDLQNLMCIIYQVFCSLFYFILLFIDLWNLSHWKKVFASGSGCFAKTCKKVQTKNMILV